MNLKKLALRLLLLAAIFSACAYADHGMPDINRVYSDPDPAAMAIGSKPGDKAAWRRRLNQVLQKYPNDIVALTSRAYLRSQAGDYNGANSDYQRALAVAEPASDSYRHILWSLGWSHFNLGNDIAALDYWLQAERQHQGSPYWVPYTIALSHWRQGRKDVALAYYRLAVENNADWGTQSGAEKMTQHWKPQEKMLHAELFSEYLAQLAK